MSVDVADSVQEQLVQFEGVLGELRAALEAAQARLTQLTAKMQGGRPPLITLFGTCAPSGNGYSFEDHAAYKVEQEANLERRAHLNEDVA